MRHAASWMAVPGWASARQRGNPFRPTGLSRVASTMSQGQAVHQDLDRARVLRRVGKVHLVEGDIAMYSPPGFSESRDSSKLLFKAAPAPQSCSLNLLHKTVPQSRSRKLLSKAAPNSCSPKLLKLPPKVVSESCFPKLLSKAAPQSCPSSKQLTVRQCCCKAAKFLPTESRVPKKPLKTPKLLPAAVPRRCSPKLFSKAVASKLRSPQNFSAKRLPKTASQSCYRKLLSKAAVLQGNCSAKWSKLLPKAVPRSCFLKLFPKAPLQSACPKAAPESCSPKLLPKAAPQSCVLKLVPKAAVLQSCCSKLPCKTQSFPAPQSCSPNLLHKAAPPKLLPKQFPAAASQSCSPKHRRKPFAPKLLCFKPVPKAAPPKLLSKAAPESCSLPSPKSCVLKDSSQSCAPKLRFFKAAVQSWSSKLLLLPKAAPQSCSIKLFPKATPESCYYIKSRSEQLLRQAAPESCFRKLLPKVAF